MRLLGISVIALTNRQFPSLGERLEEAAGWVSLAASQGADLVVLPEALSTFGGDGEGNPAANSFESQVVTDWRMTFEPVLAAARGRCSVVLCFPWQSESGDFTNSMFVVESDGAVAWRYDKCWPTPTELDHGIRPGKPQTGLWRDTRIGGSICFDSCFPEHFEFLANEGVDLVLCPSLWPGGTQLASWCKLYSMRAALSYPAWSRIIDIDGEDRVAGGYRSETFRFGFGAPVFTTKLNLDRLAFYGNGNQGRMVDIQRTYGERIEVNYDQENCLWFIDSKDPTLLEADIASEFELVTAKEYFRNCRNRVKGAISGKAKGQAAFSLTELLVIMGIILVLAVLLTSGLGRFQAVAERATCTANLRTIGGAIHGYAADNDSYLPPGNRPTIGNFGRILSEYVQPMKTNLMAADSFYCPTNVRLGSPPVSGYPPGFYKGWSGYFFNYLLNASIFRITSSDPNSSSFVTDNQGRTKLSAINFPTQTVALMDMRTRPVGVSGPPTSGLARGTYFDPDHAQFSLGLVHAGAGNILFVDGHVEQFRRQKLPVMSLPTQSSPWWPTE